MRRDSVREYLPPVPRDRYTTAANASALEGYLASRRRRLGCGNPPGRHASCAKAGLTEKPGI